MEQKNKPVDVIAMYSAAGEIRPLRLRMEDEHHQLMRVGHRRNYQRERNSIRGHRSPCFLMQGYGPAAGVAL